MAGPRLAIIADDLTGALDSAAPFAGIDGGVVVATHLMALPAALEAGGGVVAVSTRSREIPAKEARGRVAAALAALGPDVRIFKKIDSRLKGHLAAELDPVRGPLTVLPAIPEFGRIVMDGALQGFGVETPLPVLDALGAAAGRAVVPDVATDADMARALASAEGALVGARGLAQALAASWGLGPVAAGGLPAPACIVVGSTDPITRAQVAALSAARDDVRVVSAPGGLVPAQEPAAGITVIMAEPGAETRPVAVAAALADGVRPWLAATRGALLTGGATAEAVLDAAGIDCLKVAGEALPGLPLCRAGGRVIVTKSGGFGAEDALLRLAPAAIGAEG
ncbi:four-carbon acid sugar kinase family protein [Psychromarinibacter sp. S121]|uniref:four-carbon acid sugar kinase family protein n=1 Tax=Psychromarinibacter sp. S121 TaxID=3415127 RepID=UPI003C79D636